MSPDLVTALRAETPAAPHRLRERVAAVTATTPPSRRFTTRRILSFAVPVAAGLSLAAALAVGLNTAIEPNRSGVADEAFRAAPAQDVTTSPAGETADRAKVLPERSPLTAPVPAQRRAQDYRASLTLLVDGTDELSATTQRALRTTRRLGGYVLSVNYSTPEPGDGTAAVRLRIPVSRVQAAIVELSAMGRILAQDTQVSDLQQGLDELTRRIRDLERRAARAQGVERAQLLAQIEALRNQRVQINRQAAYATVNLDLTTHEPKAPAVTPGRIDRALDDAVGILLAELAIAAYALIVASPFILLGLAAFFGNRAYRRHADQRLLERA
ncbi:MAG TPA: DUF4349 domain-containing protein [Gaiellaceae bacterium]|jgi:uncharacterized protein DUF4349|nr:DUF4349 domain-containing protein [Gaiellaceae bacterium]